MDLDIDQRWLLWAHSGAKIIQQSSQWEIESWRETPTLQPSLLQIHHGLLKAIWKGGSLPVHLLKVSFISEEASRRAIQSIPLFLSNFPIDPSQ